MMSVYAENLEKCRGLSFVAEKNVADVWLRQSYRTKMCLHVFRACLRGPCLDLICPAGSGDKLQWLITGLADKKRRTCQKCYWVGMGLEISTHAELLPCRVATSPFHTRRRIGDGAFSVAAPRAWNRLTTDLKLLQSTDSFLRKLKTCLTLFLNNREHADFF